MNPTNDEYVVLLREALKKALQAMPDPYPPVQPREPGPFVVPPQPSEAIRERMNDPYYPCDERGRSRYAGD